ncbi:hypothetical protein J3U99_18860 [Brucella pituitosa]|uniref:hypothetical protein n=1 Tax=Brucella pituitosa TaxID=571256 RepID=UPI002002C84C|nr:hypothetical protein [Brucella pituitosa]MCK4206843.1 hypothetical protein [Brucella pituitosa]
MSIAETLVRKSIYKAEAHNRSRDESKYPAHILILIWLAMIAACVLFWIVVLRFLLSGL